MPTLTLATTPVPEPIVATPVFILLHTPEGVALLRVDPPPIQTCLVPVIGAGSGLTTTVTVAAESEKQPAFNAYTVYTPADPRVALAIVGLSSGDVKPAGPVQLNDENGVVVDAVKLIALPSQTGLLLPAVGVLGNGVEGLRFKINVSGKPEQLPVPTTISDIIEVSVVTCVEGPT